MATQHDAPASLGSSPDAQLLVDIEVLAMDAFAIGDQLRRRLIPIVRAIEVAHVTDNTPRGRRGSVRDPRSDD